VILPLWALILDVRSLKSLSDLRGETPLTPDQELYLWTPLRAPPPDPRYRLALAMCGAPVRDGSSMQLDAFLFIVGACAMHSCL